MELNDALKELTMSPDTPPKERVTFLINAGLLYDYVSAYGKRKPVKMFGSQTMNLTEDGLGINDLIKDKSVRTIDSALTKDQQRVINILHMLTYEKLIPRVVIKRLEDKGLTSAYSELLGSGHRPVIFGREVDLENDPIGINNHLPKSSQKDGPEPSAGFRMPNPDANKVNSKGQSPVLTGQSDRDELKEYISKNLLMIGVPSSKGSHSKKLGITEFSFFSALYQHHAPTAKEVYPEFFVSRGKSKEDDNEEFTELLFNIEFGPDFGNLSDADKDFFFKIKEDGGLGVKPKPKLKNKMTPSRNSGPSMVH